jgi:hypothetical protein
VDGTLGDLAASAFPELCVECHQVLVASEADVLGALARLTDAGVEVLLLRRRLQ